MFRFDIKLQYRVFLQGCNKAVVRNRRHQTSQCVKIKIPRPLYLLINCCICQQDALKHSSAFHQSALIFPLMVEISFWIETLRLRSRWLHSNQSSPRHCCCCYFIFYYISSLNLETLSFYSWTKQEGNMMRLKTTKQQNNKVRRVSSKGSINRNKARCTVGN